MYDYYLTREKNAYYKKGENIPETVNGEKVMNYCELTPTNAQKSFYGKAHLIITEQGCYLKSYDTIVAGVINGKLIKYWGDWSATTSKHLDSFLAYCGLPKMNKKSWLEL